MLRFRAALDSSNDAIFLVDVAAMQFVHTNAAASIMLGYSREELLAMGPADLSKHSRARLYTHYNRLIAKRIQIETIEEQLRCKDRSTLPVELSRRRFRSDGRWLIIAVARDITEAKRAARKLVRSEARYRTWFDLSPLPMWIYDLQTLAFLTVNKAAISQYGFTREEFLAMTIRDIRPAVDVPRLLTNVTQLTADFDYSGYWRHCTKAGKVIEVEITSHQVDFAGRRAKLVQANDVTARQAAEAALQESKERFDLLARATNDIVWDWDLVTDKRWWNQNMSSLLGYDGATHASGPAYWGVHPEDKERVATSVRAAIASHSDSWSDEYRFRRSDGQYLDIYDRGFLLRDATGTPVRMIGAMMDISERKRSQADIAGQNRLLQMIAQGAPLAQTLEALLRFIEADAPQMLSSILLLEEDGVHLRHGAAPRLPADYTRAIDGVAIGPAAGSCGTAAFRREPVIVVDIEHDPLWQDYRALASQFGLRACCSTPIFGAGGTVLGTFAIYYREANAPNPQQQRMVELVTQTAAIAIERARAAAKLTHHLTHDLTTGLPRFALVEDFLQSALATAAAQDERVVVLYVDLDYFHTVNETRGRSMGDEVLRAIADRLSAVVGTSGKVAHVAGDEFALIQIDTNGKHDQIELGETVRAIVAEPLEIGQQQIYVTCSIGVSCFPDNATTPQDLLRQAEAAMMRAKREGRNTILAFSNDQNEELRHRFALGLRLHDAIRDGHLLLHYQPQISGLDWQVLGFEALVRWQDAELGLVMPKVFIQAAEELGLIIDLGNFVLNEACRQARAWIDAGASEFSISVNISPLQLQRPEFSDTVRSALAKFRLPPRCIELELTESVMMENVERTITVMQTLKALGVRLALDDFGTGYSSLNYLRRFPIDCLKIDQSFVRDVITDTGSAGICRAVITLGHQLGMQVLAEGVETAAQVAYLKRNDCDLFQGYYFSKAVTAEKALEILRHRYLAHADISQNKQVQTLLLVDDETNILSAMSRALRRDGYRILTATCGEEALDVLGREDVHVIVSDQRMPGISGTELLRKVKDMHPETVRMVLSGYTDLDAVTEAINEGAIYKFLTKPWNDEELRMQIRDAFRMRRSRTVAREQQGQI